MPGPRNAPNSKVVRYGPAELYGTAVQGIRPDELRRLASALHTNMVCPFKGDKRKCHKKGGVCSLGRYERTKDGFARIAGGPVATCPSRFLESGLIFRWVGEVLLGTPLPEVVREVPFLMAQENKSDADKDEVGRIDSVLIQRGGDSFLWCALELQAVYFSGGKMETDLKVLRKWLGPGLPFPVKQRRPDFRSSGPKRLMPQLQIKVPTLRRWGKKMAVVVDSPFWSALGNMRRIKGLSNADIAWFVVKYSGPSEGKYNLEKEDVVFTTLEDAVEGLTGGLPVSLEQFESAIRAKLASG